MLIGPSWRQSAWSSGDKTPPGFVSGVCNRSRADSRSATGATSEEAAPATSWHSGFSGRGFHAAMSNARISSAQLPQLPARLGDLVHLENVTVSHSRVQRLPESIGDWAGFSNSEGLAGAQPSSTIGIALPIFMDLNSAASAAPTLLQSLTDLASHHIQNSSSHSTVVARGLGISLGFMM